MPEIVMQSRYNYVKREGWKSSVPSMTQQQFKDEADINYIVSMYDSTGVLPSFHGDGQPSQPIFADFASLPDNAQESYNQMLKAKADFDNLPLNVRKQFNYNPAEFLAFAENPNNADALVAMGLAVKTQTKVTEISTNKDTDIEDNNTPKES